jgi:hypothetical protein
MREIRTSGSMSGEGKRTAFGDTAPLLDSTVSVANPTHPRRKQTLCFLQFQPHCARRTYPERRRPRRRTASPPRGASRVAIPQTPSSPAVRAGDPSTGLASIPHWSRASAATRGRGRHPGETLQEDFLPQCRLTAGSLAKAMGLKDRTRIERIVARVMSGPWRRSGNRTFSAAVRTSAYRQGRPLTSAADRAC